MTMSEGIDLRDNYDGVDYNDYKFDEALRKLESPGNPNRPPHHALDELKSGCVCALMLILVWFLIMIFH